MSNLKKISNHDSLNSSTTDELRSLARAVPGILALSEKIGKDPVLSSARLNCFIHSFRFGGSYRLDAGILLKLWKMGIYRDEECFFVGGTGDSFHATLIGVNAHTGNTITVEVKPQAMMIAGRALRLLDNRSAIIERPSKGMPFKDFLSYVEDTHPSGEAPSLAQLRSSHPLDFFRSGKMRYMEFVKIPRGEFLMGRNSNTHGLLPCEFPGVPVKMDSFQMMPIPVTREMWHTVTGSFVNGFDELSAPATNVSWHECMAFAKVLSELDYEYDYSLPTEAQWEYACRAGSTTDYPWGNDPLGFESSKLLYPYDDRNAVLPVGLGNSNEWGIYDMWTGPAEWCLDRFSPVYPTGLSPFWLHTGPGLRAIRGGFTQFPTPAGLSGSRPPWYSDSHFGTTRRYGLGFRLVRTWKKRMQYHHNPLSCSFL